MEKILLVVNRICPFAERTLIAAQEKKIGYEVREVDLTQKEPYFKETYAKAFGRDPNSDGKVPILIDGDLILAQSDLILEYIDAKYKNSEPTLIPDDPLERVKAKLFINKFSNFIPSFYSFIGWNHKNQNQKEEIANKWKKILEEINENITLPYAIGDRYSYADIMFYPWFNRICVVEEVIGIPIDPKMTKIKGWFQNMEARQAIKKIKQPKQFFIERYRPYMIKQ